MNACYIIILRKVYFFVLRPMAINEAMGYNKFCVNTNAFFGIFISIFKNSIVYNVLITILIAMILIICYIINTLAFVMFPFGTVFSLEKCKFHFSLVRVVCGICEVNGSR